MFAMYQLLEYGGGEVRVSTLFIVWMILLALQFR